MTYAQIHRKVAKRFPPGTRVKTGNLAPATPARGTVVRFVKANNSQGGHLVVDWDSGIRGCHSAGCLVPVKEDS